MDFLILFDLPILSTFSSSDAVRQFFSPLIRDHLAVLGPEDEFSGLQKPYDDQCLIAEPGEHWNYGIGKK